MNCDSFNESRDKQTFWFLNSTKAKKESDCKAYQTAGTSCLWAINLIIVR